MVKAQRHAVTDVDHKGTSADWYFDVTKSGGYLIEQSVHNLDVCNWVIGIIRCAPPVWRESDVQKRSAGTHHLRLREHYLTNIPRAC